MLDKVKNMANMSQKCWGKMPRFSRTGGLGLGEACYHSRTGILVLGGACDCSRTGKLGLGGACDRSRTGKLGLGGACDWSRTGKLGLGGACDWIFADFSGLDCHFVSKKSKSEGKKNYIDGTRIIITGKIKSKII